MLAAGLPVGVVLGLLAICPTIPLFGQVTLHASLGARYTSTLVHDSIVDPFDVRPDIAPALGVGADLPLAGPWRLVLLADVSSSPLRRHLRDGTAPTITRLWMVGVGVGLRRQLEPWMHARLAIGALKYLPARSVGLFQAGSTLTPYGSLTFVLAPPLAARHRVALELGGDLHRFLTPVLRNNGFVDPRAVYRVTAGLRLELWSRP
jgi:hypothetical protein